MSLSKHFEDIAKISCINQEDDRTVQVTYLTEVCGV